MITGAGGLLGRAVVNAFAAKGERVTALDHRALDISNPAAVSETIETHQPDVVINCAAWTDVDGCESDRERAMLANARGPELLALACRYVGALLITISTDYVFDGRKDGFYTQRDQPNPQSIYAISKLEGERRAQTSWARTIVVRSSYVFGAEGTNFLSTFGARLQRGERLKVVHDSFGTPTFAPHLAERLHQLAQIDLPGLYHVVNSGEGASFADFIGRALGLTTWDPKLVEQVSSASLARPAARPANSRLRCLLSPAIGLPEMPNWEEGLREFIAPMAFSQMS